MKIIITGGCGFVGSHLVNKLSQLHDILVVDSLQTSTFKYKNDNAKYMVPYSIGAANIEFFKPDVIIHAAALTSVPEAESNPKKYTNNNVWDFMEFIKNNDVSNAHHIFFSSGGALYGECEEPATEEKYIDEDKLAVYAYTKYIGEEIIKLYTRKYTILRPSNIYGPNQAIGNEGGVIAIYNYLSQFLDELPVFGDGEQTRDFVHVDDVVDCVYKVIMRGVYGTFNVSSNTCISLNNLVKKYKKKPLHLERRPGDITHSVLSNSAISKTIKKSKWKSLSIQNF